MLHRLARHFAHNTRNLIRRVKALSRSEELARVFLWLSENGSDPLSSLGDVNVRHGRVTR